MDHDAYPNSYIRSILTGVKTTAMVGASPVNVRPSYFAFKYLAERGMGVNSRTLSSKRAPIPTSGMRLSLNRTSVAGGATTAADRAAKDQNDVS